MGHADFNSPYNFDPTTWVCVLYVVIFGLLVCKSFVVEPHLPPANRGSLSWTLDCRHLPPHVVVDTHTHHGSYWRDYWVVGTFMVQQKPPGAESLLHEHLYVTWNLPKHPSNPRLCNQAVSLSRRHL
jgi:hypothetical protein